MVHVGKPQKTVRLYLYLFQSPFKKDPFKKGAYKKFLEKVTIFIFEHFLYHNCDTKTYKKPYIFWFGLF